MELSQQSVSIDSCLSSILKTDSGVPQGSILGPILYILFTNELPDIVQEHLGEGLDVAGHVQQGGEHDGLPGFTIACTECGSICCYADDTTYSTSSKDPQQLTERLSSKYLVVAEFMLNNRLKLNDEKTHLMVMTTSQYRRKNSNLSVEIRTPTEVILPTKTEKLLGALVNQDLKWAEHILLGEDALVKGLAKRLGDLKQVCKVASFKNRKMVAEGLIMSKLSYLIPVWAGCESYLLHALQVIQNKAARFVTRSDLSTVGHLGQCGWLSVKQLAMYQTCVLVYKVLQEKSPMYLYSMFNKEYIRNTRQAARMELRQDGETPELGLALSSFRWRALREYNQIPADMRKLKTLQSFKTCLWKWIVAHIPINA